MQLCRTVPSEQSVCIGVRVFQSRAPAASATQKGLQSWIGEEAPQVTSRPIDWKQISCKVTSICIYCMSFVILTRYRGFLKKNADLVIPSIFINLLAPSFPYVCIGYGFDLLLKMTEICCHGDPVNVGFRTTNFY